MVISSALAETMQSLDPKLPEVDDDDRRRLGEARGTLAARAGKGKKA
jgi:hypothetical protein